MLQSSLRRSGLVLACALVSAPLATAGDAVLTRTGCAMGQPCLYELDGDPGQLAIFVMSFNTGPTPLALIDPIDPRFLEVGIDLAQYVKVFLLDPAGHAEFPFTTTSSPGVVGAGFHAQYVTVPGFPTFVDEISNRASFVLAPPGTSAATLSGLSTDRGWSLPLVMESGDVLVAGGRIEIGGGSTASVTTIDLYREQLQAFEASASALSVARSGPQLTLLADGRVLITGGYRAEAAGFNAVRAAEIYDPTSDAITVLPDMTVERAGHTTTLLQDGRVLITGGVRAAEDNAFGGVLPPGSNLKSTELFDPVSETFAAGPMFIGDTRALHAASALADGRVLVTGGIGSFALLGTALLFDPADDTFATTTSMPEGLYSHAQVTLADGRVIVAGGLDISQPVPSFLGDPSAEVYLFDPVDETWSSGASLVTARAAPLLFERSDGKLVVSGGAVITNVATGAWTPIPSVETAAGTAGPWSTSGAFSGGSIGWWQTPIEDGDRILSLTSGSAPPYSSSEAETFYP